MKVRDARSLPLLAADPVALAIAEGRQRQHRQPMRWQPVFHEEGNGFCLFSGNRHPRHSKYYNNPEHFRQGAAEDFAPWRVGDSLYVRECWSPGSVPGSFWFRAGGGWQPRYDAWERDHPQEMHVVQRVERWRPSIHMPKKAARTWVKLTRVWAERVQDISEEDARAEGVGLVMADALPEKERRELTNALRRSRRSGFRWVWERFYPGSWERNDWLWCCASDGVEVRP